MPNQKTLKRLEEAVDKLERELEKPLKKESKRKSVFRRAYDWLTGSKDSEDYTISKKREEYLKMLLVKDEPSAFNYCNLGSFYLETGRLKEAEANLNKARELDPNNNSIHYKIGECLRRQNRPDEAKISYQRAKELGNEYAESRLVDIFVEEVLEKSKQEPDLDKKIELLTNAADKFKKDIKSDPENSSYYHGLTKTLGALSRIDHSVKLELRLWNEISSHVYAQEILKPIPNMDKYEKLVQEIKARRKAKEK